MNTCEVYCLFLQNFHIKRSVHFYIFTLNKFLLVIVQREKISLNNSIRKIADGNTFFLRLNFDSIFQFKKKITFKR